MDIDDVLVCLSQIDKTNLHKTIHFEKRVNQRKDNIRLKLNSIDETHFPHVNSKSESF